MTLCRRLLGFGPRLSEDAVVPGGRTASREGWLMGRSWLLGFGLRLSEGFCGRSGGIQGGLANGEIIVAKVAFKPTSTISRKQVTVSRDGKEVELRARGRHDPCVVPRAVPMVEAMVALVIADQLMQVRFVLSCFWSKAL
jgi:Chorismate synthase